MTLRDVTRRTGTERDPRGKAALFSKAPPIEPATHSMHSQWRPFTLVLECSDCGRRARVTYVHFAKLALPVSLWLPIPGLRFNRRMACPSCRRHAWLRAEWLA